MEFSELFKRQTSSILKGEIFDITDEDISAFQKLSLEERLSVIYQHMLFIHENYTHEERILMYRAKGGKNLRYYEENGWPEHI